MFILREIGCEVYGNYYLLTFSGNLKAFFKKHLFFKDKLLMSIKSFLLVWVFIQLTIITNSQLILGILEA